jgi:hypothetical protein
MLPWFAANAIFIGHFKKGFELNTGDILAMRDFKKINTFP